LVFFRLESLLHAPWSSGKNNRALEVCLFVCLLVPYYPLVTRKRRWLYAGRIHTRLRVFQFLRFRWFLEFLSN